MKRSSSERRDAVSSSRPQPCSVQAVLDALLSDYDADAEQCEADLLALVDDMAKRGLIEIKDGPIA